MLNQLFHHTQSLFVSGDLLEMRHYVIEDILSLALRERLDYLLNHVLALVIFRKSQDIVALSQSIFDDLELLFLSDRINDVLKSPCASVVARNVDKLLAFDKLQELDPLVDLQVLDKF